MVFSVRLKLVVRFMDVYLVEVVCDSKLFLMKFFLFVEVVLVVMRVLDDGFYRVIDMYFKVSDLFLIDLFFICFVCLRFRVFFLFWS